jgi:23S rRNA (uracil1939-C5)-methyltransferase
VPVASDPLAVLTCGRAAGGALERHAETFFPANRFLLPALDTMVLDSVARDPPVLDLYAGVGLFAVSRAACGHAEVTAVEGDRISAGDLQRNAALNGSRFRVAIGSVEEFLRSRAAGRPGTIVVDPPRTGLSKEAMQAVVGRRASRVVYVSCDPPTMARDARRLLDGGYRLASLGGLDLFPNTPHVEAVGVFDRA